VVTGEFDRVESNPFFQLNRATSMLLWTPEYYSPQEHHWRPQGHPQHDSGEDAGNPEFVLRTQQLRADPGWRYHGGEGFKLAADIFGDCQRERIRFQKRFRNRRRWQRHRLSSSNSR